MTRYLGRYGESRVAKAALISAVPPLMVKTAANPLGLSKEVFDGLQAQLAANRLQFYRDLPAGPFYVATWWPGALIFGLPLGRLLGCNQTCHSLSIY